MLLSVIIPVYNGKDYIQDLMEQIKRNVCTNTEFIVVNDGSGDNSEELICKFSAGIENFRLISKENGGVSTARNVGMENACGEYIWFVDADDIIEAGAVESICTRLESGLDLYVFDSQYETQGRVFELESFTNRQAFEQTEDSAALMMKNLMTETHTNAVWNKVFKREIIEKYKIEFPAGVINGEDTCFLLDYCDKIQSLEYVKESIYLYIIRQGSAANNIRPETVKGFVPVYEKKIFYSEKYGLKDVEEHIRKGFVNKMLRAFFHMKRNAKVNNEALKECIKTVVSDEFTRKEFEKTGCSYRGTVKLYYRMHMRKNVKGIYSLVSAMAFVYNLKRKFVK